VAKSANERGADRTDGPDDIGGVGKTGLTDFEERLKRARSRRVPLPDDGKARGSAMGMAFRTSTEMIAGLVVGGLVGWQLDKWLGTSPVLLLLFFLLGAAAGIWNVIRAAWEMQSKASKAGTEMDQPGSDRDK
jgi:ATP synthase protein I